ncbi:MAG: DUF6394 family protein [Actinobacteria bacterium]|uniref:DUF6394 family protein n=1 Tax=Nostocoides veronense TaxID=330836 RepID=A0ABN2LCS9_9MICO|nr:DUF6394 family protein [Actinomycetota bacterium]
MSLEKVVFGFFVVLAATLNFGYFIGELTDPNVHNKYELFAAVVVNIIAVILKFGDRTQIGALHLATSLVAAIQLLAATVTWLLADADGVVSGAEMSAVVSISGGALMANVVSIVLLVAETITYHRR